MNAQPLACPPFEQLRAFGLGQKLDPEVDAAITEHLGSCETCTSAVATISGDDFLARRRAAEPASQQSRGTPAPDGSLGGLAKSLTRAADSKMAEASVPADIPPELANHPEYEVIRELGRGGMGVVYLVKNRLMDRLEALKVMATGLAVRSGAADRFLQEIRSAAQLTHQYVVNAHSARQVGDLLMLSMEYVPDGDLGTLVKDRGPLPVVNACYYTWQVALALQHAHEKGMVHRDIKPSNLILLRNGKRHTVKVTDFGLAKARKDNGDGAGLTSAGQMMGTPHYMSPEQALDAAQVDIRADIYSLGCTLYFLLTGRTPFSGGPMEVLWKHREEVPRPVNELRPEVLAEVAAIVARMMAKDPADRYQTPAEVARALSPHLKRGPRSDQPQAGVATATPQSTAAGTVVPMPLPPDREDQWGDLTFSDAAAAATVVPVPAPESRRHRPLWIWPAVVAGGLIVGLFAAWGAGAFKVKTKDGVIVLENLPDDAEVVVNGEVVTVTRNGEEATITLNREGPHRLKVTKGGNEIFSDDISVALGGDPVRIRIERPALAKSEEKVPPEDVPKPPGANGFVPLFNGQDLSGWKTEGGFARQWGVENRTLIGSSPNPSGRGYLLTSEKYQDFILRFEFQFDAGSTAAVAIRAVGGELLPDLKGDLKMRDHPVLVLADDRPEAVYSAGSPVWLKDGHMDAKAKTQPKIEFRPGRWYPMEIVVRGETCIATSGGTTFAEINLDPDRATHRGIIPGLKRASGHVGFIAQVGTVRYRNIEICELGPDGNPLAAAPPVEKDGFAPIFNKKDLTGWTRTDPDDDGIWVVQNGRLVGRGGGTNKTTYLATKRNDYGNFHLRIRLRHDDGVSFLYVRRGELAYRIVIGRPASTSAFRIPRGSIDRTKFNEPKKNLKKFDKKATPLRKVPQGEWFTLEVIAQNEVVRSLINGQQVAEFKDAMVALPPGPISLSCRGAGAIQIESIEIKELQPPFEIKAGPPPAQEGNGNWTRQGDELVCGVQAKELGVILFGDDKWTDYDVSADVLFSLGSAPFTLLCRQQDETHFYGLILGGPANEKAGLLHRLGKDPEPIVPGTARLQNERWHTVKISARGKQLRGSVFEAGQTAAIAEFSHNDVILSTGRVGLGVGAPRAGGPGSVRIRNVKVTNPEGSVLWYGLPEIPS